MRFIIFFLAKSRNKSICHILSVLPNSTQRAGLGPPSLSVKVSRVPKPRVAVSSCLELRLKWARELLQRSPPAPRRKPRVKSPKRKRKPRTRSSLDPPTPKAKGKAKAEPKAEAKAEAKAASDTGAPAAESVEGKPETTPMKENELEDSLAFMEEGEEEFPDICFEEEGDEEEMLLDDELLDLESEEDLDLEDDEEEGDSDQDDDAGEAAT
eukprot:s7572_g3.t2